MLQPGNYTAEPVQAVLGKTQTGKEQIGVEFAILDEDCAGQTITWYGYFTDGTFERTIESLRACGFEGDDLSDLSSIAAAGSAGVEVGLVVEHEEYQGKTSAKVRWVNKAGGGVAVKDRLSDGEAKAFAAVMRGRLKASAAAAGAPSSRTSSSGNRSAVPTARAQPKDDDLPF